MLNTSCGDRHSTRLPTLPIGRMLVAAVCVGHSERMRHRNLSRGSFSPTFAIAVAEYDFRSSFRRERVILANVRLQLTLRRWAFTIWAFSGSALFALFFVYAQVVGDKAYTSLPALAYFWVGWVLLPPIYFVEFGLLLPIWTLSPHLLDVFAPPIAVVICVAIDLSRRAYSNHARGRDFRLSRMQ